VFQTTVFLDPQGLELISQPEYWLFDLRLAYLTPGRGIEFALWVTNLSDEQYLIDVFDLAREFNTILQVWGEPRMFGATVSYNF
jgi:outer membrane receptor protein involved in Fe transport